jgi:hypothetical protein
MTQTSLPTFNIFDLTKQKVLSFTLQEPMEKGCFGKISIASTPSYQEQLVAKTIDLAGRSQHMHFSPHYLLRTTYREIAYLKQLGLLVGFSHDVANKKMIIIMKLLPGIPEIRVEPKTKRFAEFASFCALRQLHRNGIAHMDPHENNFLFDENTEKAHVIDFGSSQDTQYFHQLRDFYQFLILRRSKTQDKFWYFLDFYCTELKDHILANRYETAKTVFCYAAVMIAALSGVSVLGVVSLLAQELIKAAVLPAISELLSTLQDHYEFRAFNQHNSDAYRKKHYALVGALVVLQSAILAFQIFSLYSSVLGASSLYDIVTIGIHLQAWSTTCQYWIHNAEKYCFSESLITSSYQDKIAPHIKSNTFLPLFQQSTSSRTAQSTVDTQNEPRPSALPRI